MSHDDPRHEAKGAKRERSHRPQDLPYCWLSPRVGPSESVLQLRFRGTPFQLPAVVPLPTERGVHRAKGVYTPSGHPPPPSGCSSRNLDYLPQTIPSPFPGPEQTSSTPQRVWGHGWPGQLFGGAGRKGEGWAALRASGPLLILWS